MDKKEAIDKYLQEADMPQLDQIQIDILEKEITLKEWEETLIRLKCGKAPGHDG